MGHNWDQLKKIIMTYDFVTPLERWELAGGGYHVVKKALGTSVSVGRLLIQSVCQVLSLKRKILDEDG